MKRLLLSLAFCALPLGASAETLADVRAEVGQLGGIIADLRSELTATGSSNALAGDASTLNRLNTIEAALQRLTSKTEQLDFKIRSVVKDGTNRVGDLEFRICELDPACDIGNLAETFALGGGSLETTAAAPTTTAPSEPAVQVAIGEEADFNAAKSAFDAGDFNTAADKFAQFSDAYPGGPYSVQASFLQGKSQAALGDMAPAARAYLNAFSQAPDGPVAPEALFNLGTALADLGQTKEACVTLGEVSNRFAASDAALQAQSAYRNMGCS